ncbi:hypothetical protein DFH06DRAFT_1334720 [Mycena polygramma]|nr:hypothetical protein DFH06DRAFT_1334720 [Mycena polygramma]
MAPRQKLKRDSDWDLPSPFWTVYPGLNNLEYGWTLVPKMLAELRMYNLSWALRRKPDWQKKASDPEILSKWRMEVLAQQKHLKLDKQMTEKMVDYVLDELKGYAKIADNERSIERGNFDAIWYSDRLFSDDLRERLKAAADVLENLPDNEKDWHPGSKEQVLDLVHPSLYCIVYGRTQAYIPAQPHIPANLRPMAAPTFEQRVSWSISPEFCWLPSDFSVGMDGSVKLLSPYINNLHPAKHQSLYRVIEEVLSGFIPMFDRVLGDIDAHNPVFAVSGRVDQGTYCIWGNTSYNEDNHPDWEYYQEELRNRGKYPKMTKEEWYNSKKHLPEAGAYAGELEQTLSSISLRGRAIQCIVKLANIQLSPKQPKYAGGSWHIEGMSNEHIVASGIYYYDEENITQSDLSFRVPVSEPDHHGHNDHECAMTRYGIYDNCTQALGKMITKEGRSLVWPNIYQHCVSSFKLTDPSKPGHRKILAIFLVDPTIDPIPSTTTVPPQQGEWACEALRELHEDPQSLLSRLPQELVGLIQEQFLSDAMTLKEAEAYRIALMKERKVFVKTHSDTAYGVKFDLCEH